MLAYFSYSSLFWHSKYPFSSLSVMLSMPCENFINSKVTFTLKGKASGNIRVSEIVRETVCWHYSRLIICVSAQPVGVPLYLVHRHQNFYQNIYFLHPIQFHVFPRWLTFLSSKQSMHHISLVLYIYFYYIVDIKLVWHPLVSSYCILSFFLMTLFLFFKKLF